MEVEVLIASCCTPFEVKKKVISVLEGMKGGGPRPRMESNGHDGDAGTRREVHGTDDSAIYIDGELEFMGYPKQAALQAKIKERHSEKGPTTEEKVYPH